MPAPMHVVLFLTPLGMISVGTAGEPQQGWGWGVGVRCGGGVLVFLY